MVDNILAGFMQTIIVWIFIALGGGAVIAYLEDKKSIWGPRIRHSLSASAVIFFIGLMITVWRELPKLSETANPSNAESQISRWLYEAHMKVQSLPPLSSDVFRIRGTSLNEREIDVGMNSSTKGYIAFQSSIILPATSTMPDKQKLLMLSTIRLELVRLHMHFGVDAKSVPLHIQVSKSIAIQGGINRRDFVQAFEEVDNSLQIIEEIAHNTTAVENVTKRSQ